MRVIHACCVLHNIANVEDLQYLQQPINDDEYPNMEAHNLHVNYIDDVVQERETGVRIRNELCELLSRQ